MWWPPDFSSIGTTGNGAAACASARAAGTRSWSESRAARAAATGRSMPSLGREFGGELGQASLVPARGLPLDDAMGGGAIQDGRSLPVGGLGLGLRSGLTHSLDGRAHPAAQGHVTPPRLLVRNDTLGGGFVMRHANPPWRSRVWESRGTIGGSPAGVKRIAP